MTRTPEELRRFEVMFRQIVAESSSATAQVWSTRRFRVDYGPLWKQVVGGAKPQRQANRV
jgi:hypothetical protein